MIDEKSNLTTIDALILRKQPFAVYRVPGEKYPRLLTEDVGAVRLIYDLKELNGQRGFVIAPFRVDKSCPIVLIQSDRTGTAVAYGNRGRRRAGLAKLSGGIFSYPLYREVCDLFSYIY